MSKFKASVLVLLLTFSQAYAQNIQVDQIAHLNSQSVNKISASAIDIFSNSYISGSFKDSLKFNSLLLQTQASSNDEGLFIKKLSPTNKVLWSYKAGAIGNFSISQIASDSKENVYSCGYFDNEISFPSSAGSIKLQSNSIDDIFIVKHDKNGKLIWAKSFNSPAMDQVSCMAIGKDDEIYIGGRFTDRFYLDSNNTNLQLTSQGEEDLFFAKIDELGNPIWCKRIGGTNKENLYALALDQQDNIYIGGFFENRTDFDPSLGGAVLITAGVNIRNAFIGKYDKDGNYTWAKQFGKNNYVSVLDLTVDINGAVISTGFYQGTSDFDPGPGLYNLPVQGGENMFVSKLDAAGDFEWAAFATGGPCIGTAVDIDQVGNVYTTGLFEGTVDFDPSTKNTILININQPDIFISILNSKGKHLNAWSLPTANSTDISAPTDIHLNSHRDIHLSANIQGKIKYDLNDPNKSISTQGNSNGFYLKYKLFALNNDLVELENKITAYPNPSNGEFTINSTELIINGELSIYNSLGEKILSKPVENQKQIKFRIDATAGNYYAQIIVDRIILKPLHLIKY